jgi:Zeta toxin
MTDDGAARYKLSDEENRRIFREEIVPREFAGLTPQETPTVVFLVGQPGAGKTRVGQRIGDVLDRRGGFVDVDSDLYKPYHPAYDDLMRQADTLMAAYTRADGRSWMAQAHEYVRSHKLNALIQETTQDGEAVAATIRAYRAAGFQVEAMMMGVGEAMSRQGIVNRYHEQVKDRGSGRLTVQRNADESYRGIIDLAQLVDDGCLADRVDVFRRGEVEPRYRNALDRNGQWEQPPELPAAIVRERNRPWTVRESAEFLQVQGKLHTEMGPEWSERLDDIDDLAAPQLASVTLLSDHDLSQLAAQPDSRYADFVQEANRRERLSPQQRQAETASREHVAARQEQSGAGKRPGHAVEQSATGIAGQAFGKRTNEAMRDPAPGLAAEPVQPTTQDQRPHPPQL